MAAAYFNQFDLEDLALKLEIEVNAFMSKTMMQNPELQKYISEEWNRILGSKEGTRKIVHGCLVFIRKLEQFLSLARADAANAGTSVFIKQTMAKFKKETGDFVEKLAVIHGIEMNVAQPMFENWFNWFFNQVALHPHSEELIKNCRDILILIYPDPQRQKDKDEILSKAGLPTSTENVESWLKRLEGNKSA